MCVATRTLPSSEHGAEGNAVNLKGDPLAGGEASSIYTVRRFVGYYQWVTPGFSPSVHLLKNDTISISIDHKSGMPLFWTLTNGGMGTKV